jgi:multiple sugar transport system ATP-binding protein
MAQVILDKIYKSFPSRQGKKKTQDTTDRIAILKGINLTVADGEFMVLVGPSGCGKSTLLRLIAGLEEITAGEIWVGDRLVNSLPPKQRDIAMVFQNYALYPHLTVYDNIAFGLRRMGQKTTSRDLSQLLPNLLMTLTKKLPPKLRYLSQKEQSIYQQVYRVAELLQIESLLDRLPKELSGGQRQRVALGRAIARNPQVFLMDEPLSNLDAKLRTETRSQIVKLQRQLGTTTIYVTHDQTEAMTMGDRIAVMNQGEILQVAPPLEIYHYPANRFVAEFIGSPPMNFLEVEVKNSRLITHAEFRLTLPEEWEKILQFYLDQKVILGIRPEHLNLSPPALKNLEVEVDLVEALGNDTYLSVHLVNDPNTTLQARIAPDQKVKIGDIIWLSMTLDQVFLFEKDTGKAIR